MTQVNIRLRNRQDVERALQNASSPPLTYLPHSYRGEIMIGFHVDGTTNCISRDVTALPQLQQMFGSINRLFPRCSILMEFCRASLNSLPVPAAGIAALLNQAVIASPGHQNYSQVCVLRLNYLRLWGDTSPLVKALQLQTNLNCCSVYNVCFGEQQQQSAECPSALGRVLSRLPKLRSLRMKVRSDHMSDSSFLDMVAPLVLQGGQLQRLTLSDLPLSIMNSFWNALQTAPPSRLKWVDIFGKAPASAQHTTQAGRMLQHNTTLECLHMSVDRGASLQPLATIGLKDNTTLRKLELSLRNGNLLCREDLDPFLQVLETSNYTLEQLLLHDGVPRNNEGRNLQLDKIDFYLSLNKDYQRKRLLLEDNVTTTDDWIQVLSLAVQDENVPVLFYYLSLRPDLILSSVGG